MYRCEEPCVVGQYILLITFLGGVQFGHAYLGVRVAAFCFDGGVMNILANKLE